jgi:4a-hydroxytetrahydrobiopterin dehydratase
VTPSGAGSKGRGSHALAAHRCVPGAPRLTEVELVHRLAALPGWTDAGNRLEKTFRFANYFETIAFVNALAYLAHREGHHPDLGVHYDRCVVAWSTHSAGGVTLNDCICAAKVDQLAVPV